VATPVRSKSLGLRALTHTPMFMVDCEAKDTVFENPSIVNPFEFSIRSKYE